MLLWIRYLNLLIYTLFWSLDWYIIIPDASPHLITYPTLAIPHSFTSFHVLSYHLAFIALLVFLLTCPYPSYPKILSHVEAHLFASTGDPCLLCAVAQLSSSWWEFPGPWGLCRLVSISIFRFKLGSAGIWSDHVYFRQYCPIKSMRAVS